MARGAIICGRKPCSSPQGGNGFEVAVDRGTGTRPPAGCPVNKGYRLIVDAIGRGKGGGIDIFGQSYHRIHVAGGKRGTAVMAAHTRAGVLSCVRLVVSPEPAGADIAIRRIDRRHPMTVAAGRDILAGSSSPGRSPADQHRYGHQCEKKYELPNSPEWNHLFSLMCIRQGQALALDTLYTAASKLAEHNLFALYIFLNIQYRKNSYSSDVDAWRINSLTRLPGILNTKPSGPGWPTERESSCNASFGRRWYSSSSNVTSTRSVSQKFIFFKAPPLLNIFLC